MDFPFKKTPFAHQREVFERFKGVKVFALWMEQGTGKSKVILDTTAWAYLEGRCDALVIIAPNGVHLNWVTDELPEHMTDAVPYRAFVWNAKATARKWFIQDAKDILAYRDGLAVVTMNVDAVITPKGKAFMQNFLQKRRAILTVDESTIIKTPGAARTKTTIALGRRAVARRMLTGTPVTKNPLDVFSQFKFLDEGILGSNFHSFKHEYARWRQEMNWNAAKTYEVLEGFKNLDRLKEKTAPYVFRVLKEECLDLPPKTYQKERFDLPPKLAKVYEQLREELIAQLENGEVIQIKDLLHAQMRLQQVTSGFTTYTDYVGPDRKPVSVVQELPEGDARFAAFTSLMERLADRRVIVWARFRREIDKIAAFLTERSISAVRYDGSVGPDDRALAKALFQATDPITSYKNASGAVVELDKPTPPAQFFVGNVQAAARGLTLTRAEYMVYYSNHPGLELRLQSEDRFHRIGQSKNVTIIDLAANGTVDEGLIRSFRSKKGMADAVTGDNWKDWI